MEFKQLEAFASVVEWNSFSEAARRIYLTQPTISSHIRALETELNTTLLNRTTKHIEVTEEGQYLYEETQKILQLRSRIYEHFSQNPVSTIRLGASTIPALYLLPNVLPVFKKRYPVFQFELWQSDSMGVIERMQEHDLDLGFVGTKVSLPDYTFLPFARDELIIAAPANDYYRKLHEEHVSLERLMQEPIILREQKSGTRKEAARFLERMHIPVSELNVVAQMNDQEMIKSFIRKELGISIMSGFSVAEEEKDGSLLVFHLGENASWRDLYMVYEKKKNLSAPVKQFIQLIHHMFSRKS